MAGTRLDIGGAGEHAPVFLRNGLSFREETSVQVLYPASVGPVNLTPNPFDMEEDYARSVTEGYLNLVQMIGELNDDGIVPALAGYSLGASVLNRFLEDKARGLLKDLDYKWSLTIGSPHAPLRNGAGGIVSFKQNYPKDRQHVEIRGRNDIICNTPEHSALRTIPHLEKFLSLADGNLRRPEVKDWLADAFRELRMPSLRDAQLVMEYLNGKGHEKDYFTQNLWAQARVLP